MGEVVDCRCSHAALVRKYRELLALRRGELAFDVGLLRRLSHEFPGALRELDALPLDELEARLASAKRHSELCETSDAWIDWMRAYHGCMRAALDVRRELKRERRPAPAEVERIQRAVGRDECDADFVRDVATPPEGRLNRLVFARLSRRFGQPAAEIERRLFRPEARA